MRWSIAVTLGAAVAAGVLRAFDSEAWRPVLAGALVLVGVRILLLALAARRREQPWTRLLVPAILLIEGLGMVAHDSSGWQLRIATAIVLEIAFVAIAIRELVRAAATAEPIEDRLSRALGALVPEPVARFAAFEFVVVGSAFALLLRPRRALPAGFSYHRTCRLRMLLPLLPLLALGDVILIELVFVPLLADWAAIALHALAIYGLIWIVGFYATLRRRPHQLVADRVILRRGLLRTLELPRSAIARVESLPEIADDWKRLAYLRGALRLDISGERPLELHLHAPVRARGLLGEGTPSNRVIVTADDAAAFARALSA